MKKPTYKELKNLEEKRRKFKRKIRQKQERNEINLLEYKEIKDRNETISSLIEKTLNKELNNIEEVEPESEDLTEVNSEEEDDWLNNSYEITPLYGKFKIKNQEVNVIIDTEASTNIITKILLEKLNTQIEESSNKIFTSAIKKVKAKINLENDIIKINRRKTQIKIPISCKRTKKRYENPATHMVNLLFDKSQKKIKKKEIILNNELTKEE